MATTIGFLGLGIMGSRMAANLQGKGFDVRAWTHTPGKAEDWVAKHPGATATTTPAEAAAGADIVISMVVDGDQVRQLLLDGPDAAAPAAKAGALFLDMSTIAPEDARDIGARLADLDLRFVDAPVTG